MKIVRFLQKTKLFFFLNLATDENEEAAGCYESNAELVGHQQKMLVDMKEMFYQFGSKLTKLENN